MIEGCQGRLPIERHGTRLRFLVAYRLNKQAGAGPKSLVSTPVVRWVQPGEPATDPAEAARSATFVDG